MISYANTYTVLDGYSSNMNVNNKIIDGGLEKCKEHCNSISDCNGFTFDETNNKGYLSNKTSNKVFGYRNLTEPLVKTRQNYKLYMRDPKINNNHKSCSNEINKINNITADDWVNYLNNNNNNNNNSLMTSGTTCGLYKSNKQIKERLELANNQLDKVYDNLLNNTTDVIRLNNNLDSQVNKDKEIITGTSDLYNEIDNKYKLMSDNNNLNNILNNSNLVITQSQYYYIIWIILILLIIIGVIIILRRI